MSSLPLFAKRINHGQSEIWFGEDAAQRRVVATNGIVYPIRTQCPAEESEAFHKVFADGTAKIPESVVATLVADFKL